jgi:hypothetical protein
MPDTHMSIIYEMLLRDIAARIGKKYFPESYNSDGFIASLAIKTALIIVLFRTENFVPKKEEENVTVFSGASMLSSLNYAVKETKAKGKKTLKLKKWFADYFEQELDKRVAFIRLQYENGVGIAKLDKSVRIIYLPLFETYKYFYNPFLKEALPQVIKLFKNKNIENSIKDDIFINFVINIQKIIGESPREEIPDEENFFKDKFILLIIEAFENLSKKIIRHIEQNMPIKSYYEKNDLFADSNLAVIDLILNFNLSKNNSFIGYHRLRFASGKRRARTRSLERRILRRPGHPWPWREASPTSSAQAAASDRASTLRRRG